MFYFSIGKKDVFQQISSLAVSRESLVTQCRESAPLSLLTVLQHCTLSLSPSLPPCFLLSLSLSLFHSDRLSRKEAEHSGALSGAIAAVRQETQQRVDEAVGRAKHDGEVSSLKYMHKDL